MKIPARLNTKETILIETDVVQRPANMPLILSRSTITRMRMKLHPTTYQVRIFGNIDVALTQASCGLYQIALQPTETVVSIPTTKVQPSKTRKTPDKAKCETVTPKKSTTAPRPSVNTQKSDRYAQTLQTTTGKTRVLLYSTTQEEELDTHHTPTKVMKPVIAKSDAKSKKNMSSQQTQTSVSEDGASPQIVSTHIFDDQTQDVHLTTNHLDVITNHDDQRPSKIHVPICNHCHSMQASPKLVSCSQKVQCLCCQPLIANSPVEKGHQCSCCNPLELPCTPNGGGKVCDSSCNQPIPSLMYYNSKFKNKQVNNVPFQHKHNTHIQHQP